VIVLDQVFLGPFDTFTFPVTFTTGGCLNDTSCGVLTPFGFGSAGSVASVDAFNHVVESNDGVGVNESSPGLDTSANRFFTWASWTPSTSTPVPAPGTLGLLGVASLAVLLVRRIR
jgi:hypothetical protein